MNLNLQNNKMKGMNATMLHNIPELLHSSLSGHIAWQQNGIASARKIGQCRLLVQLVPTHDLILFFSLWGISDLLNIKSKWLDIDQFCFTPFCLNRVDSKACMFMPKMHHCEKGIFTQAVNENFEVVVEVIASRQLRFYQNW